MEGGTFSDSESDGRPESRASYVDSDTGGSEVSPRRSQLVVGAGAGFGLAVSTGLLSGTNAARRRRRHPLSAHANVILSDGTEDDDSDVEEAAAQAAADVLGDGVAVGCDGGRASAGSGAGGAEASVEGEGGWSGARLMDVPPR